MAPFLFALALMMQDAPAATAPSDGPMATAVPRKQDVAPLPIQGGAVSAPTDDYGYVGWCAGVMASYVELYDRAMPEVIRIERAWPTPSTEENIAKIYPEQREEAKRNLALFARAMKAAEQASPTPIQSQGQAAVRRGRAVWTGAASVPKAQLAQFWMSWSPPAKCEETAKALEIRSRLFGQALSTPAPLIAPPLPPVEAAPALLLARPSTAPLPSLTDPDAHDADLGSPADAAPAQPDVSPTEVEPPPVAADAAPQSLEPEVTAPDVTMPDPVAAPAGEADGVLSMTPVPVDDPDNAAPAAEPPATAIDDLLQTAQPVAEPAPAPAAASPPTKPRRYKKGLRETLGGLRGSQ